MCERLHLIESADLKAARRGYDVRRKRDRHLSLGHFPIEFIHFDNLANGKKSITTQLFKCTKIRTYGGRLEF